MKCSCNELGLRYWTTDGDVAKRLECSFTRSLVHSTPNGIGSLSLQALIFTVIKDDIQ